MLTVDFGVLTQGSVFTMQLMEGTTGNERTDFECDLPQFLRKRPSEDDGRAPFWHEEFMLQIQSVGKSILPLGPRTRLILGDMLVTIGINELRIIMLRGKPVSLGLRLAPGFESIDEYHSVGGRTLGVDQKPMVSAGPNSICGSHCKIAQAVCF
jgi:hypothetical protein